MRVILTYGGCRRQKVERIAGPRAVDEQPDGIDGGLAETGDACDGVGDLRVVAAGEGGPTPVPDVPVGDCIGRPVHMGPART
jgi:hypothetical protein